MMLFLAYIDVSLPPEMPQERKDDLRRRENARAIELMKAGTLRRIWRIVGQTANHSLWEAATLEDLHAAFGSLPLYPFIKLTVTPLIEHPVTAAWRDGEGDLPSF